MLYRISSLPALHTHLPLGQEGELAAAPGLLPICCVAFGKSVFTSSRFSLSM